MKRLSTLIFAGLALAIGALLASEPLPPLSGLSKDVLSNVRMATTPRPAAMEAVTAILIDEASLNHADLKDKPQVLWSKAFSEFIDGMAEADAAVVGFDYVMAASMDSTLINFEQRLRQSARRSAQDGKLVLGKFQPTNSMPPVVPNFGLRRAVGDENIRTLNVKVDDDRVIRQMPHHFLSVTGEREPSFLPKLRPVWGLI